MSPPKLLVLSTTEAADFCTGKDIFIPKAVFLCRLLISVPSLIQCRKLSTDNALLGSSNPSCFLMRGCCALLCGLSCQAMAVFTAESNYSLG